MYSRLTQRAALGAALLLSACDAFNAARQPGPSVSAGTQVFGVLCDRMVALNFPEDVDASRFDRLCHPGADGRFGNPPDTPAEALADASQENTRLAYARVRALAVRRTDLSRSFDAMLPENEPGFMGGLRQLVADISPLYDREIPAMLKGIDQVIVKIQQNDDAVNGLTRMLNRDGYRPADTNAGLMAALANQAEFPALLETSLRVMAPSGANEQLLNQLLEGAQAALKDAGTGPTIMGSMPIVNALLSEDDELFQAGSQTYVALRDSCGAAAFNKDTTVFGQLKAADTCRAMDTYGRFLDAKGAVLLLPAPFPTLSLVRDTTHRDTFDRALDERGNAVFQYVSVNKTPLAGILAAGRDLFQPKKAIAFDLLANVGPALGDLSSTFTQSGATSQKYDVYAPNSAPMIDVAIAMQPLLKSLADDNFEALDVLARAFKRDDVPAQRLIVALLKAKDLANADTYATYDPKSAFWDEMFDILAEVADTPAMVDKTTGKRTTLLGEMLASFAAREVDDLPEVMRQIMNYKDQIDYNPDNINGPAINKSAPAGYRGNAVQSPVERTQADNDGNRSLFSRIAQLIHETNGVRLCNKENPTFIGKLTANPCELLDVQDMAAFFLQSVVVNGNRPEAEALSRTIPDPNKAGATIVVMPGRFPLQNEMGKLTTAAGSVTEEFASNTLKNGSGIDGMTLYPTPGALARALFRREDNDFLDKLLDPASTALCAQGQYGPGALYTVRSCSGPSKTLRMRHQGTFLALESTGFINAIRPIARPFVKFGKESLFLRVMTATTHAWPSKANTACDQTASIDTTYCTRSGMVTYEPLLAKIFSADTDLLGSLHAVVKGIEDKVPGATEKLAPLLRAMFSRDLNQGLADRQNFATSKRNDGSEKDYLTPALLIVKALDEIEKKRALDASALAQYRAARSGAFDTIFAYDTGSVATLTRLRNAAVAKVVPSFLAALAKDMRTRKTDGRFNDLVGGGLVTDMRDFVFSPLTNAALQTTKVLRKDSAANAAMNATIYGALNPDNSDVFISSAASVADLLQALNDTSSLKSLLPAIATAFVAIADPSRNDPGAGKALVGVLATASKIDTQHRLTTIVQRAVSQLPSGRRTPLDVFADTIVEVSRADPSKTVPYTADDTRRILSELRSFLGDDKNGFKRIVDVIQKRNIVVIK